MKSLRFFRQLICSFLILIIAACGTPEPTPKAKPSSEDSNLKKVQKIPDNSTSQQTTSRAKNISAYEREIAVHISQKNPDKIYVSNPQALLRSVVVLKFSIDANGKLVSRELIRSNKDKETEATAMQSLVRAQPFPIPPTSFLKQGKLEMLETWLFNTDGRFQLRTIALPQRGE